MKISMVKNGYKYDQALVFDRKLFAQGCCIFSSFCFRTLYFSVMICVMTLRWSKRKLGYVFNFLIFVAFSPFYFLIERQTEFK